MLWILASGVAALALALALDARRRVEKAEDRISALTAEIARLRGSAAPDAPEAAAAHVAEPSPSVVPLAPSPEAPAPAIQSSASPPPAPPRRSLEERIGARWAVYLGGLALALGALLLVRYAIESGAFGPGARVTLGLALAAALIASGEALRRREKGGAPTPTPAVLTAAGTIALFGAIFAAHALYGFIGPTLAFLALGAAGLATLAAAALHGPALAGLGLAGALATPLLVHSDAPSYWPVVVFVAVVAACADALARLRGWAWLAEAALWGAGLWGAAFALADDANALAPLHVHLALHAVLGVLTFAAEPPLRAPGARIPPLLYAGVAVYLFALAPERLTLDWQIAAGAIVATLAVAGYARAAVAPLLPGSGAVALGFLIVWPPAPDVDLLLAPPHASSAFLLFAAATAGLVSTLAGARLWREPALAPRNAYFLAGAATLAPLGALGLAYLRLAHAEKQLPFGLTAGALSLGFLYFAHAFAKRAGSDALARFGVGAFASATLAALSLGLVFTLDRGMLTVALALSAAGAAHVAMRLDASALRWCVVGMGVLVLARLAYDPRIVGGDLGARPILNWLLFGYGAPALAFAYAARCLRRSGGEDAPTQTAQALAIVFSALLAFFEIHHALNAGDALAVSVSLQEAGLHAFVALCFTLALAELNRLGSSRVFSAASLLFGVVSSLIAVIALGFESNPFLVSEPVAGGRWLNALLLAYALPGLFGAFVAARIAAHRPAWFVRLLRLVALGLVFGYVTLQTRRLFQSELIVSTQPTPSTEFYAYSPVWLALGAALLAYGLWRASIDARVASAAVILLAVVKVFVFDLSELEGVERALSFIGLGFALIGIGLVYQRVIFRRSPGAPT